MLAWVQSMNNVSNRARAIVEYYSCRENFSTIAIQEITTT